jgi:hypothetical protein
MGNLSMGGDDVGMILRATQTVLRSLSIVPKTKYCLSVAYCGLSAGHEAQLLDLLSPTSATVSLRDGSAAAALAAMTCWSVEDPCDVLEVGPAAVPPAQAPVLSGKFPEHICTS